MVTWRIIQCIHQNGNITGYAVEFNGSTTEVVGRSFNASGLTPARNYTFRVAGVNINGTGPFTNYTTITTDEDGMHLE
jgi:hypothetical protein